MHNAVHVEVVRDDLIFPLGLSGFKLEKSSVRCAFGTASHRNEVVSFLRIRVCVPLDYGR